MTRAETGVLLLQLGTPDAPRTPEVRRYLREFLSDPRVLDIHPVARWLLLRAVILPFRSPRSAEAYRSIWGPEGSPLWVHTQAQAAALAKRLGESHAVEVGMRYGSPAIEPAIERLCERGARRIVVAPLFPQYAASSLGSALEHAQQQAGARWNVPLLATLGEFHADPGFVEAVAARTRETLADFEADHVLFSYHGLPERQIQRSDPIGGHCLAREDCCEAPGEALRWCYRAQCYATTRAVAAALDLAPERHSSSFQSRLGRTPWIRPYTDLVMPELAQRGVRRLAVLCPSFVADCLETLEEIQIRARESFIENGGEDLRLVPAVNSNDSWVEIVAGMLDG